MIDAPNPEEIEEYNDSVNPAHRQTLLDELAADLAQFESQYGMTSSDFNERFQSGELGDAMDYFDWSAAFQMFSRIQGEQDASE